MVETGPWQARVRFAPGGGLAYRPGELLVRVGTVDAARAALAAAGHGYSDGDELLGGTWVRFTDVADPLEAIEALDPSLRKHVESLLDAHEEVSFLERPPPGADSLGSEAERPEFGN